MDIQTLEHKILHEIPITQTMGLKLIEASGTHAKWFCPLKPNINHLGTAFGGSLYSASAVSCYTLLLAILNEEKIHSPFDLVISKGEITYTKPIASDFEIQASIKAPLGRSLFLEQLRHKKRAAILLQAHVYSSNISGSSFEGRYVVTLK